MALEQTATPVRAASLADFETEMRSAVDALCTVLARGYALADLAVVPRRYLDETTILSPTGAAPLLSDGRSTTTGSPLALNVAWRESERAVALHAELLPMHAAKVSLQPHLRRIEDARGRARLAEIREGNRQAFDRTRGSITPRADVPPVYRQPDDLPPPAPVEADWATAAGGRR